MDIHVSFLSSVAAWCVWPPSLLMAVEWLACGTSVVGALIVALNSPTSRYGFVLLLLSNLGWLASGLMKGADGWVVFQSLLLL